MKITNFLRIVLLLFICMTLIEHSTAQTNPERARLAGLEAVRVRVQILNPDLEREGITRSQIQTDVELRLRRAGIRVIDSGKTYFDITIFPVKIDGYDAFAYTIKVELKEMATLNRDRSISFIATPWQRLTVGYESSTRIQEIARAVSVHVDEFINDFLAASSSASSSSSSSASPNIEDYFDPPPSVPAPSRVRPTTPNRNNDSPFVARYVGGNRVPEIEITNSADRILSLTIGQNRYTINPATSRTIVLEPRTYTFQATAPNVTPLEGEKEFARGYVYTWEFYIVTRTRTYPSSPGVIPRRRRGRRP